MEPATASSLPTLKETIFLRFLNSGATSVADVMRLTGSAVIPNVQELEQLFNHTTGLAYAVQHGYYKIADYLYSKATGSVPALRISRTQDQSTNDAIRKERNKF